jgi:hypothetical protein
MLIEKAHDSFGDADHRPRRLLLRAHRERPCDRSTAEQRDELAPM